MIEAFWLLALCDNEKKKKYFSDSKLVGRPKTSIEYVLGERLSSKTRSGKKCIFLDGSNLP